MSDNLHSASVSAAHAARYLAMAAALDLRNQSLGKWLELGIEGLTETANALGYVLLRTGAEEASDEPAAMEFDQDTE